MAFAYVGTFTSWDEQGSEGVYSFELDPDTGALEPLEVVALEDPSFLVVSPTRGVLYVATHTSRFEGQPGSGLIAYAIDPSSGSLERLGSALIPSPHPANVKLDRTERFVLTASGLGGAACVFPIGADGAPEPASAVAQLDGPPSVPLGARSSYPHGIRPGAPHAHCAIASPDNRFVLVADLGHNRVYVFRFDAANGTLTRHSPAWQPSPPDVVSDQPIGARHLEFHPSRDVLYVNNERHSSVSVFDWDAEAGLLAPRQTLTTVAADFAGRNATADLHVHPSGRLLYVSNRGEDSLAVFAIDSAGLLEPLGRHPSGGSTPRGFVFSPDGRLLLAANQASGTVVAFRVDERSGALEATGAATAVPCPVCIASVG